MNVYSCGWRFFQHGMESTVMVRHLRLMLSLHYYQGSMAAYTITSTLLYVNNCLSPPKTKRLTSSSPDAIAGMERCIMQSNQLEP